MEQVIIAATNREGLGVKGALSKIRAEKNVPAVVYGGQKEPVSITVGLKDLEKIVKAGKNTIVELNLPTGKELALVKEIQYHVVKDTPIHVDFQRVALTDKMDVVVPLRLTGIPADVVQYGALVEHILRQIEVRAMVSAIPHEIEVDIAGITIHKGLLAGDLPLPAGVELITHPESPIVHLTVPKEDAVAEVDATAPAAPESASTKGKKDDEGNLAKGTAAAAAPAKDAKK